MQQNYCDWSKHHMHVYWQWMHPHFFFFFDMILFFCAFAHLFPAYQRGLKHKAHQLSCCGISICFTGKLIVWVPPPQALSSFFFSIYSRLIASSFLLLQVKFTPPVVKKKSKLKCGRQEWLPFDSKPGMSHSFPSRVVNMTHLSCSRMKGHFLFSCIKHKNMPSCQWIAVLKENVSVVKSFLNNI